MLTISYTTTVNLRDLFECHQKFFNTTFELVNRGKTHVLLNYGLDKVLCRMRESLIFATKKFYKYKGTIKFHTKFYK